MTLTSSPVPHIRSGLDQWAALVGWEGEDRLAPGRGRGPVAPLPHSPSSHSVMPRPASSSLQASFPARPFRSRCQSLVPPFLLLPFSWLCRSPELSPLQSFSMGPPGVKRGGERVPESKAQRPTGPDGECHGQVGLQKAGEGYGGHGEPQSPVSFTGAGHFSGPREGSCKPQA